MLTDYLAVLVLAARVDVRRHVDVLIAPLLVIGFLAFGLTARLILARTAGAVLIGALAVLGLRPLVFRGDGLRPALFRIVGLRPIRLLRLAGVGLRLVARLLGLGGLVARLLGLGGLFTLARLLSLGGVGLRSVALGGIFVVVGALLAGCRRTPVRAFAALGPAAMRRSVVRLHARAFQPGWEPGASILRISTVARSGPRFHHQPTLAMEAGEQK